MWREKNLAVFSLAMKTRKSIVAQPMGFLCTGSLQTVMILVYTNREGLSEGRDLAAVEEPTYCS